MASLEDASLMGLDVDIGATTVTIQSPRQELLQRQEVSGGLQAMAGSSVGEGWLSSLVPEGALCYPEVPIHMSTCETGQI